MADASARMSEANRAGGPLRRAGAALTGEARVWSETLVVRGDDGVLRGSTIAPPAYRSR